jgi:hypothetical protein
MKYDVSYNLTEEIRQLLDSDYKHDINSFEVAKKHILLLLGKPELDIKEYTEMKKKLTVEFFKSLEERIHQVELTGDNTEQIISYIAMDLEQYTNAYNLITLKYMNDTVSFLMGIVNGK